MSAIPFDAVDSGKFLLRWSMLGWSMLGWSMLGWSMLGWSMLGRSLLGRSLLGRSLLGRSLLGRPWPVRQWLVSGLCMVFFAISLSSAWACKYTVRDVAFVEMDHSWYRLYLYLGEETSAEEADQLRSAAALALADSNVNLEVITVGKNQTDASLSHWQTLGIDSTPSAVLVSPDRRARRLPLPASASDSPDAIPRGAGRGSRVESSIVAIRQAIDTALRSPRRSEILAELMTAHSIVLIIAGEDQQQNRLAKTIVKSAIDRITATLPDLPKPIEGPPQMILLSASQARAESLMLWSLGVDIDQAEATQIAMVFGRGRRLGSVMDVREIAEQDVLRTLAVVGLDCECDLDRSWMQAPMFPHVWTTDDESQAVKSLGFDPGHPLVKVEISRILSRGPSSSGDGVGGSGQGSDSFATDALLPGLQIIELDFDDEEGQLEDQPLPDMAAVGTVADGGATIRAADRSRSANDAASPPSASDDSTSEASPSPSASVALDHRQPTAIPSAAPSSADTPPASTSTSTTRVVSATLLGLAVIGLLGGAFVVFYGRRSGP